MHRETAENNHRTLATHLASTAIRDPTALDRATLLGALSVYRKSFQSVTDVCDIKRPALRQRGTADLHTSCVGCRSIKSEGRGFALVKSGPEVCQSAPRDRKRCLHDSSVTKGTWRRSRMVRAVYPSGGYCNIRAAEMKCTTVDACLATL